MKTTIRLTLALVMLLLPVIANADDTALKPFQLSYADAEGAIGFALAQKGAGGNVSATINTNGRKSDALYAYGKPISVEIHSLQYDKPSGRWSANLMFLSGGEVVSAIPVGGRFEEMIEVPVLKREVRNGDIISGKDIELQLFPVSHTRTDTVGDISSLIGKTPTRVISPSRPIRASELLTPAMIKKNALVEIRFTNGDMELSTTGQAMDEGAKGDVISVRNTTSKKIIRATVEDTNTVTVSPPDLETSAIVEKAKIYAAN